MEQIADSRYSSKNTIRVTLNDDEHEDFIGNSRYFYVAWMNNEVWTGPRIVEEERWLKIIQYDNEYEDSNGKTFSIVVAIFRGETWRYCRVV